MKILAPVSSAREAECLISCGARELYCGLHPGAGTGKSRTVWINRRGPGPANISSLEELKRVADFAGTRGVPVFLTMNLPYYSPEQYPAMVKLAGEAASCGIKAFIIGDPGLILALRKELPGAAIHVSSLAAVLNSASASFFRDLGASRIIFPRYMGLEELGRIVAKTGGTTEYEVCSMTAAFSRRDTAMPAMPSAGPSAICPGFTGPYPHPKAHRPVSPFSGTWRTMAAGAGL